MQGLIHAPVFTDFPLWPTKQNIVKDPCDYINWCIANNLIPHLIKKEDIKRMPDEPVVYIKKLDGTHSTGVLRKAFYHLLVMASSNDIIKLERKSIDNKWEFYVFQYEQDMTRTEKKLYDLPIVKHDDPADYGLTREDAIRSRLRFLRTQLKREECYFNYVQRALLTKYSQKAEKELVRSGKELDKIRKSILGETNRLRHPGTRPQKSYDIAAIKRIPMDTITEIMPNRFFRDNPFRKENSPSNSLYYYPKENRCMDFGSSKSYDVIDVYSAVNKCDTKTAMKELSIVS